MFALKAIGFIFPHQLTLESPLFDHCDQLVIIEESLFFKQFRFHKAKLTFHRASMRSFYKALSNALELPITYVESMEDRSDIRLCISDCVEQGATEVHLVDPTDDWLLKRALKACTQHGLKSHVWPSQLFLTDEPDADFFRPDKKFFFHAKFYQKQRQKFGYLMQADGLPAGGQWSFDQENRKKYPKNKTAPAWPILKSNAAWNEAANYVTQHFSANPGSIPEDFRYPIDHLEAEQWFQTFLEERFAEFGPYEDAMVAEESLLNHSLLSPLLNVGLLKVQACVEALLEAHEKMGIPINSTEGLLRQLIGWRAFIRGIYQTKGGVSRTRNFWGFKRQIPDSFYTATTGIVPVDQTISKLLDTAYCHHIERLMILGNFMLLCEFDPDEVYRWFMELFIDAYDWVMVPNVYGMSQFADGGIFATKPYISGSNYIRKMSNFPRGEWESTWDGLYSVSYTHLTLPTTSRV